jgi:AcrR family transcriptional regulator
MLGTMGRPRTFDMDEALTAVREEFWRHGYAATSVDKLLEVTKLGKGSLYAAFGDKRTLFLRVLNEYAAARVAGRRPERC